MDKEVLEIMDKLKQRLMCLNVISIIGILVYINIGTIAIINRKITYLELSKGLFGAGIICFLLYIAHKILYKEKLKLKDGLILLLSIFIYSSYYFSIDKTIALYGCPGRNEGLLSIYSYYFVFLLASTIPSKHQKKIMNIFLMTGFFQIILGTIQILQIKNIFGYDRTLNWSAHFEFASGTLGNPNFYATYILMCLMYVYGILLKSRGQKDFIIYLILTIIFTYGLFIANTLGCLITFILMATITLIRKINKKNIKNFIISFIIGLFTIFISIVIVEKISNKMIMRKLEDNISEISEIMKNGLNDSTGNYRVYVWKETLKKVPNYILTGIGIDNFKFINNGSYICVTHENATQCFDKVHNEYLQIIITEGIFTLILYLALIVYVIYNYIKYKSINHKNKNALFTVFIAYLIQAFFNISVITVAPIFYMIMGFIIENQKEVSVL